MVNVSITAYAKTQGDIKHNGLKLVGEAESGSLVVWQKSEFCLCEDCFQVGAICQECTMLYTY